MAIDWDNNKLTDEIKLKLKSGTKIKFKWHGNSENVYVGRIEVDSFGELYFVNEHCYDGDTIKFETMRFCISLDSFYFFTMFEILHD